MKPIRPILILTMTGLVVWSPVLPAQQVPDQLIELKAEGARVFAATRTQTLTPPAATPAAAVRTFLTAQGKSARALNSLVQTAEWRSAAAGMTHARFRQSLNGLDVYGAYVKATVNSRGELVHLVEILPEPPPAVAPSNVSARAAVEAALRHLYPNRRFQLTELPAEEETVPFRSGDGFFSEDPRATRMLLPLSTGAMQEGWLVETWTRADNQLHHTVVSNGARVLAVEERTANDNYKVFVEHPLGTPQQVMAGPGTGNTESPKGWLSADGQTAGTQFQFRMSGNNVDAYLDTDANNSPDSAGTPITGSDFLATAVLTDSPATAVNKQVAIQNLFWANNTIHDQLYKYGFTESAGNFQENNLGKGGLGSDSVLAEAQDGSGTNNANFSTPSDGSNPRMQMFLWTAPNPDRDGDVDTDIVYHEYGHGLTWRMVGSMSGCMSGAVGEGASDTLSLLMNNDDVVGEYSYNNPNGIRRWPYEGYPFTYGQLTNEGVHAAGEILGAAMWRVKKALANDALTWQYFVGGLNLAPAGPKFEHIRDAMVSAAGGLTADGCKIYKAFAEVGVGEGASGSCKVTGFIFTTTTWTVNQSFTVPLACQSPVTDLAVTAMTAPSSVTPGTTSSIGVTVSNVGNQNVTGTISVKLTGTDGTNSTDSTLTGLAAGASATRMFTWTAPAVEGTVVLTGSHQYSDGSPANNTMDRTVVVAAPLSITLTGNVVVVKGKKYVDLTWSPTGAGNVDVYKDSLPPVSTANDGYYRDGPQPKGVNSAKYKVCAGTSCSNLVTVSW